MGPRARELYDRLEGMVGGYGPYHVAPAKTRIEEIVPGWWVHRLRVSSVEQLDRQLQGWLRRSYRLMGLQEQLQRVAIRGKATRSRARRGADA